MVGDSEDRLEGVWPSDNSWIVGEWRGRSCVGKGNCAFRVEEGNPLGLECRPVASAVVGYLLESSRRRGCLRKVDWVGVGVSPASLTSPISTTLPRSCSFAGIDSGNISPMPP